MYITSHNYMILTHPISCLHHFSANLSLRGEVVEGSPRTLDVDPGAFEEVLLPVVMADVDNGDQKNGGYMG